jgi:hypothetical protein
MLAADVSSCGSHFRDAHGKMMILGITGDTGEYHHHHHGRISEMLME